MDEYRSIYLNMCRALNMDRETEQQAWAKIQDVAVKRSLEGDPRHWFVCTLYSTSRHRRVTTTSSSTHVGNFISLNMMLRSGQMSVTDFMYKVRVWAKMARLPEEFHISMRDMDLKFTNTFTIFKRFRYVFHKIFYWPRFERRISKYTRASWAKYTPKKIYEFSWTLFLIFKNHDPKTSFDLFQMFQLMICCMDLVYRNVVAEFRTELIRTEFKGVPKNWNTRYFDRKSVNKLCIVEELCVLTEIDAKKTLETKNTTFRDIIKNFMKAHQLLGNERNFLEILSTTNCDRNLKFLNASYEQSVLSKGEIDERIFTITDGYPHTNTDSFLKSPNTPYTRQHMLPNKNVIQESACKMADSVRLLVELASIHESGLNVNRYGTEVTKVINEELAKMEKAFAKKFPNKAEWKRNFELSKSLFHYLQDHMMRAETIAKPTADLKRLLMQPDFTLTLMACSIELVLEAYNSQLRFPWTLKCFDIDAFNFYRIIEPTVLHSDGRLTRQLIKHLNFVEETCLESLAWQKDSQLWMLYKDWPKPLPTWIQVDGERTTGETNPTIQDNIKINPLTKNSSDKQSSSSETTTLEQSKPAVIESEKAIIESEANDSAVQDSPNKSLPVNEDDALPKKEPIESTESIEPTPLMTKKVEVFFRKFYKLAWIRITKLCNELDMRDPLVQKRIWTLFEYSISQQTTLMLDRHLDQMIMCAIYIYIRVSEISGKTFTDIMKFYRKQPQATSSIYREVLIGVPEEGGEPEYRDIIHFYNRVYVQDMTQFALNFNDKKKADRIVLLSPHPQERPCFPKKLLNSQRIYISPMEKNVIQQSPNQLIYDFGKGQTHDLQRINARVCGKRLPPADDEDAASACGVREPKRPRESPLSANHRNLLKVMHERFEQKQTPATVEQKRKSTAAVVVKASEQQAKPAAATSRQKVAKQQQQQHAAGNGVGSSDTNGVHGKNARQSNNKPTNNRKSK